MGIKYVSETISEDAPGVKLKGIITGTANAEYFVFTVSPRDQFLRYHDGMKQSTDVGVKARTIPLPYQIWIVKYNKNLNTGTYQFGSVQIAWSPYDVTKANRDKTIYHPWIPNMVGYAPNQIDGVCWGYSRTNVKPDGTPVPLNNKQDVLNHFLVLYEVFYAGAFNRNAGLRYQRKNLTSISALLEDAGKVTDITSAKSDWYKNDAVPVCTQEEVFQRAVNNALYY